MSTEITSSESPNDTPPVFPALRITRDALSARGAFAEAQRAFLRPDPQVVAELDRLLREKNVGVVAHYYMDAELQGVLAACEWPHIHVADSLVMADKSAKMVEAGVDYVVVLGVDFMSENARAILDAAGHPDIPVYRVAADPIGCSLAESAEAKAYGAYLLEASETPRPLHVVYINTSLITKAKAQHLVPTITCTSSNVVQTVLQAAAQEPAVDVFFGPDTYMGENLKALFEALAQMSDDEVAAVHPAHTAKSISELLTRFRYFEEGNCIVHHMFGAEVVQKVREHFPDAFVAAHLEVPGEMFALGLEKSREDAGVTGSTSNILSFLLRKLDEAIASSRKEALQFVLGTEAGMITPIVREVERRLQAANSTLAVDIIFPVAAEAVTVTGESHLPIVPGVKGGEGCSTAGGCATCPYMKMNSLDALTSLVRRLGDDSAETLARFEPRKYSELIAGQTAAALGGVPILHMRHFQQQKVLSDALVEDIRTRTGA